MPAGIIAACAGVCQFLILKRILSNALEGNMKKTALFLFVKLAVYAVALSLIFLFFRKDIFWAAGGFCIGLPLSVAVYAVTSTLKRKKKGDDRSGSDKNC